MWCDINGIILICYSCYQNIYQTVDSLTKSLQGWVLPRTVQFLFLCRNTGCGHTHPLHSRAEKSGQGPTCRARKVVEGLQAHGHLDHQAGDLLGEGKLAQTQQTHPNTALSKPVPCSTHSTVAWGAQMGSWSPRCAEAPRRCSCPRLSENHYFSGFLSWLLQSAYSESGQQSWRSQPGAVFIIKGEGYRE